MTGRREAPTAAMSAIVAVDPLAMGPEPWSDPVDGADLLDEIHALIARYVVVPSEARHAIALWILSTWTFDLFDVAPILAVLSPVKRCGKTTLLTLLTLLSRRAIAASNITDAAIFRVVDEHSPTLIIDEADTWLRMRSPTTGIINSGHHRSQAFAMRADGPGGTSRRYSTYGPKAIAAIGSIPTTIRDRSIVIELSRKSTNQAVERLRWTRASDESGPIRRQACRWAEDQGPALRAAELVPVPGINDRAQDNWEPLLAIAEVCGGPWPERARLAAAVLSVVDEEQEPGVMLLEDLLEIFAENGGPETLFTRVILEHLHALEERPWGEGQGLTGRRLALHLRPFGVEPISLNGKARGYRRADVEAAAARYVSATGEMTGPGP
jgi:putative DNA primase/helicase